MGHSSTQVTIDIYGHLIPRGAHSMGGQAGFGNKSAMFFNRPAQPETDYELRNRRKSLILVVSRAGLEPATR